MSSSLPELAVIGFVHRELTHVPYSDWNASCFLYQTTRSDITTTAFDTEIRFSS